MSTLSRVEVLLILADAVLGFLDRGNDLAGVRGGPGLLLLDLGADDRVDRLLVVEALRQRRRGGQAARKAAAAICSHILSVVVLIVIAGSC